MDIEKFEKTFALFGLKDHSKVQLYLKLLKDNGFTINDITEYITIKTKEINSKNNLLEKKMIGVNKFLSSKVCPKCKSELLYKGLNIPKGRRNKFGYKTHLYCSNEMCLFEEFSTKNIDTLVKDFKRKEKERRLSNG